MGTKAIRKSLRINLYSFSQCMNIDFFYNSVCWHSIKSFRLVQHWSKHLWKAYFNIVWNNVQVFWNVYRSLKSFIFYRNIEFSRLIWWLSGVLPRENSKKESRQWIKKRLKLAMTYLYVKSATLLYELISCFHVPILIWNKIASLLILMITRHIYIYIYIYIYEKMIEKQMERKYWDWKRKTERERERERERNDIIYWHWQCVHKSITWFRFDFFDE